MPTLQFWKNCWAHDENNFWCRLAEQLNSYETRISEARKVLRYVILFDFYKINIIQIN